jgi:hypothetical protein
MLNEIFMSNSKKYGLVNLAKRCLAVITTSLGLLSNNHVNAFPQQNNDDDNEDKVRFDRTNIKKLKPKLILKMRSNNLEDYILAQHRSHSSHSSHSSHRSHYSSGSSSDGGSGGLGIGTIIVGGLIALGAYGLGRSGKDKK